MVDLDLNSRSFLWSITWYSDEFELWQQFHNLLYIQFQPVGEVVSGYCVRINTGAPVPKGADAVVQVEDTVLIKDADDGKTEVEIKIMSEPKLGQDIR